MSHIPVPQATYRQHVSRTEHAFGTKLVIELTICSKNATVYLVILEMSNMFALFLREI